MRPFRAIVVASVAGVLALSLGARTIDSLAAPLALQGEEIEVKGAIPLTGEGLAAGRPLLSLEDGVLTFAPGARFELSEGTEIPATGASLWQVTGVRGAVNGLPRLMPDSAAAKARIKVWNDGRSGKLMPVAEVIDSLDEPSERSETNVELQGLVMAECDSLSTERPFFSLANGSLWFDEAGVRFQAEDYERLPTEGVWLWQVTNGCVYGTLELDPDSIRKTWRIEVSEDGRSGWLRPIPQETGFFAAVRAWWTDLVDQFRSCFIVNARWKYLTNGLAITIQVALSAVLLGALVGFLVAIVRSTHDRDGRFGILNGIFKVYLTVIRGTPMAVQLLIAYFVIFATCNNKTLVATLAFGLNSGAYVAEIMRAGINSIDPGQMEAGRSLGLSYVRTMVRIILPQAFRNVLPALGNEFIVLLKDTSIASFIALEDLSKGGEIIRSQTYNVYMPFLMVAAVYLVLVMFFTWLLGKLERHLRNTGADVVHNES